MLSRLRFEPRASLRFLYHAGAALHWSRSNRDAPDSHSFKTLRANFTLSQVALNDAIMLVPFAPIVALLLGLSSITGTLLVSVGLYIIIPVAIAQAWR